MIVYFFIIFSKIPVVPEEYRLESIQAALMLMPDENREVLQALLEFLHEVCQHSDINQVKMLVYFFKICINICSHACTCDITYAHTKIV